MGLLLLDGSPEPAPPAPPAPPPAPTSGFAGLIARADRAVQRVLGGEPVIYRPASGGNVTVTGTFDERYVLVQGTAEAGVEAVAPAVFLQLADLPVDPQDDDPTLTIRGRLYRVEERRTAGMGSIVLVLRTVG